MPETDAPIGVTAAPIEVLIPRGVEEEFPDRVAAVHPRVRVATVSEDGSAPDARSPRVLLRGGLSGDALRRVLEGHPSIEWVHFYSAGMEDSLSTLREFHGLVTNSAGVHGEPIAEWVIAMMLVHVKRIPQLLAHHRGREWKGEQADELGGKTLGVVGAGGIGGAIARRARGLDMRVVGLRASGRPTEFFDEMLEPEGLHQLLSTSDYVAVATPLTPQTEGLIGEPELRAMMPGGVLLNIARGKVVRTDALVRALSEGWISGAYLDVTDPEPLPPEHPLWTAPNAVVTAHTSGSSPRTGERVLDFFCENLRRWLDGEELRNVVDIERGY